MTKRLSVTRVWDATTPELKDQTPAFPQDREKARVTLWMPAWSAMGWSLQSPGFVWWFFAQLPKKALAYGENMISAIADEASSSAMPHVVKIHSIAHRYAR